MLDYNLQNGIWLLRLSSGAIPFGSSPVNTLPWPQEFAPQLAALGQKALAGGIRLSMHPGQYTVLNSPSEDVVFRAREDLAYHCTFLDAMGLGPAHKIVLHVGGVYGNKPAAIRRFVRQLARLPNNVRARLALENDDTCYTVEDILAIARTAGGVPVVFDNLHHALNPPATILPEAAWIESCARTWRPHDGPQKLHYSQQAVGKSPGSHSSTIEAFKFVEFVQQLPRQDVDVMLEVKDKNLSALKCILCTAQAPRIAALEKEWARYQYSVLARDAAAFSAARGLLKDKDGCPALAVFTLIEQALARGENPAQEMHAAQYVWKCLESLVSEAEAHTYRRTLQRYQNRTLSAAALRRCLQRLAQTHRQAGLLGSYYFIT